MKTTTYNEICKVTDKVRTLRKKYTAFGCDATLDAMVHILITCEESLEREARKYCEDTTLIDVDEYDED